MQTLVLGLLCALAIHHLSKGFYHLAFEQPSTALADYYWRRVENAYFIVRIPPQSQNFAYLSKGDPSLAPLAVHADVAEPYGSSNFSGLPPWTYALQLGIYLPTSDKAARIYLAVLDAVSLGMVGWLAYDESRRRNLPQVGRVLAVLGVLAIGATNDALADGQTSLVINAGLAASFIALRETGRRFWDAIGGIGLALGMMKPTIGLLFLLAPLVRRRWAMLATCATVIAAAWFVSGWWVHLSPFFQIVQFERASRLVVVRRGANVWLHQLSALLSPQLARDVLGAAGILLALAGAYRLRADVSATFAFLAVVSRLYTYHGAYDDVVLAFLLLHLSVLAWREPTRQNTAIVAWLVVGVSLWLPFSLYVPIVARWMQSSCWLLIGYWLLRRPELARPLYEASPV